MSEIENVIDALLNEEQNIFGVAIIGKNGNLLTQTENWNVANDLKAINDLIKAEKGVGSLLVQGVKYMIVENAPERKIGTNITGKGHLIICPIPIGGTGALICYINPQAGPRDALLTAQNYALKLAKLV